MTAENLLPLGSGDSHSREAMFPLMIKGAINISLLKDVRISLLVLPFGNAARRPRRTGGLHLLLELLQIDFDQLTQLSEHAFEFGSRMRVLIHLRLRRSCRGHSLCARQE